MTSTDTQLRFRFPAWVTENRVTLAYLLGVLITACLLFLVALDQEAQEADSRAEDSQAQALWLILEARRHSQDHQQATAAAAAGED